MTPGIITATNNTVRQPHSTFVLGFISKRPLDVMEVYSCVLHSYRPDGGVFRRCCPKSGRNRKPKSHRARQLDARLSDALWGFRRAPLSVISGFTAFSHVAT